MKKLAHLNLIEVVLYLNISARIFFIEFVPVPFLANYIFLIAPIPLLFISVKKAERRAPFSPVQQNIVNKLNYIKSIVYLTVLISFFAVWISNRATFQAIPKEILAFVLSTILLTLSLIQFFINIFYHKKASTATSLAGPKAQSNEYKEAELN